MRKSWSFQTQWVEICLERIPARAWEAARYLEEVLSGLLLSAFAGAPVKLAEPGLTYVNFDARLGAVYMDRFVSVLQDQGPIKVTTSRDLAQLLGLERQRQLMGCDENASCLAELSGALGVDALLTGSLARTGSGILVTLRVVRTSDGSEVTTGSARLSSDAALDDWLEAQAPLMARRLLSVFGVEGAAPQPQSEPFHFERWLPGAIGAASMVVGATLLVAAGQNAASLGSDGLTAERISRLASDGRTFRTTGALLIGCGVGGMAATALWVILAPRTPAPAVLILPLPQGGLVSLEARF